MNIEKATYIDGRTIDYVMVPDPPSGAMKEVYFTPDRSSVVCFFKDASDIHRISRLEAVLGRYNPTRDASHGDYWRGHYCWITGIVKQPRLGVVAPTYPREFIFPDNLPGPMRKQEKKSVWFTSPKLRKHLPMDECGTWLNYFRICIRLARSVRRLHQAGLAHSDLSSNNVLIDPKRGQCVVIDIDSLVVPGIYPPDVAGTKKYIAPEVLGTINLPLTHPTRQNPNTRTDLHAMAVLIYEYLLSRHPLEGPKTYNAPSGDEQECLEMGSKALFVEHPTDISNRPVNLRVPCAAFGPQLYDLFIRAFVKGLHSPFDRPGAIEWERALSMTWDQLHPCVNAACVNKWFVLHDMKNPTCPSCGHRLRGIIPIFKLRSERRPGQWMADGQVVISGNGHVLFKWHVFQGESRAEEADIAPQAKVIFENGAWHIANEKLTSMSILSCGKVLPGQKVKLIDGMGILLSEGTKARMAEVRLVQL